jgi:hypothetical protein
MTPQQHDKVHAEIFAEYRQNPTETLRDILRYSDRRCRWRRYYWAHGSKVVHTGLGCGAATGKNARARVSLLWWLSGQRPTMPVCRHCLSRDNRETATALATAKALAASPEWLAMRREPPGGTQSL